MAQAQAKYITMEEGFFAAFLVVIAFACLIIAGKTYDQVMAFHTAIGSLAAAAGAFIIFRNYFENRVPAPQEIGGHQTARSFGARNERGRSRFFGAGR